MMHTASRPRAHALAVLTVCAVTAQAGDEAASALVLETPGYVVRVGVHCPEGSVSCDQVRYHGVSRRSGHALSLRGRTAHTRCADGVTPCRFLGYVFEHGGVRYFVSDAGELIVSEGARVLVQETGTWRSATQAEELPP